MSNSLDSFLTRIGDVTIERVAPKNNATSPSGDQVIMNSSGSSSNQGVQGGNDEDSEETGGETSDGELERKNLVNSMMRRVDDMNSEGSGDDMDLDETIDTEIGVRMDSERMQHSMSPCGDEDDEDDDVVDAVNILDTLPLEGAPIEGQEVSEADLLGKPLSKDDDSEDISNSQTTSDQEDADPSKRRPDADETDQAKKKQKKDENSEDNESKAEKKLANMRRNIREVMDETQLDEATLSAQRQEMERLRRVQEQQRIIREVQRQIATHRQTNKGQLRPVSLLQGRQNDVSTSICQSPSSSSQAKSPNSMMMQGQVQQNQQNLQQPGMKRPMTANRWQKGGRGGCQSQQPIINKSINKGQMQNVLQQRIRMMTPSVSISPVVPKKEPLEIPYYSDSDLSDAEAEEIDKEISEKMSPPKSPKPQKGKDVVTISSSSEDSDDDCIVLSDPSGGEETDTEDDPANSGMHTNDRYNIPDEHGRVLINVGHPEGEPDVYLAPQVARIIKPHQIGGIRFLFDNIVESIERYKTSSGFGCILAHSMGLGKTLQVASFCDIFFRCTPAKTVLCIMPINTLQNWLAEFNMWLPYEDPNKPNIKKPEEQKLDIKDESCSNQTDMSSLSSRSDARSHQEMPLPPTMMGGGHFPGYENAMGGYYPPTDPMNQNYHHMYPNMNYPPMKQEMEENAMKPPLPYGVPNQGHMYGAPAQMYPPMYPPNPHQNPHQNPPPQNYPNYHNPSQYPNYPPQQQKMPENPPKQDIKTEPQEPKTKEEGTSTNKEENSEEKKEGEKVETPFSVDSPIGLEHRPRHFHLHILNDSHKTMAARARVIKEWQKIGGVLLIGYELYRQLSLKKPNKAKRKRGQPVKDTVDVEEDDKNKGLLEEMHGALVNPGPDLVICDEGHRIKNSHASISLALKQMRTKRRIVLTGYPLQNNLLEYWCMVDFVRPNYLGTKAEFCNMFERPIQNGQCIDSTPQDIRLMRYRAHVLHALLEGFVQRRSHSVLQVSLPRKEEYILLVRMTPHQRKLYDIFMNQVVKTRAVPNPLKAFAVCCKIWNHPDILYHFLRKRQANEEDDLDLEETIEKTTPGGKRPKARGRGEKKGKKVSTFKNRPAASVQPNSLVNENEIENNGEKKNFPALPPPPPGGFVNSQQQNFQQNYQEFRPSDQNAYYRNEATGEYSNYYGSNHGGQRFQNQQFPYQQGQNSGFSGQQNYSQNHQQNHQGQGFGGEEQQSQNTQKFQNPEFRGEQGSSGNYDAQAMYNRQSYNFQEQRNNYSVPAGQGSNSQGMGQQNLNQQNINQQNLNQANINQQNLNQPNINQQNMNSQNLNQQNLNQQNLNQAPINQQNYQNPLPNQSSVPINDYTNYQHQNQTQSHNYPPNPNQIYRNDNQMNQHNYPPPQEPNSHNNSQQTGFISNQPSGNQSQPLVTNAYSNQPQPSSNYQQNQPQSQVYQQNQSQSFMNNRQVRYQNSQTNFPPPTQAHGFNSERQPYSAAPPANQGQNYNQGQRFPAPQSYQSTNQNESNGQASNYQNSQGQQNHIQSQPNQLHNPQNQMQNSQNLMQNQQNHMQNQQNQMPNQQNQLQNYTANDTNNWQGNYQNQGSMNQVNQLPQGQNSMTQGQIPQGPNSMAQGQIPQNSITQGQNSMLQGPNSLTQGPNPIQPPSNPNQMNQAQWDQNQQSRFGTGNYFPQNYPQNSYDYQGNPNPSEMNVKQEENKNIPQNVMRPPNVPNFDNKKDIAMGTQTLPQSNFQGPEANPPRPLQNVNFNTNSTVCKDEDKDKDEIIVEKDKEDKSDDEVILKDEEKDLKCSPSGREDPGIPYDWATELMKGYVPGLIDASAKMTLFFCILEEAIRLGDRVLTFSQSLFTLNLIEDFLARNDFKNPDGTTEKWAKNVNYYRLDGSTTALEREKLINEFNANKRVHLFLVSTRAGSLGINLVGANRAIVFDASWNPCHDTQAVCRVYRYGQKKPCYVYRLVTDNCLERKIYDRQISKQGMADRVVDQCNPDAHLSLKEATTLSWDSEEDSQVQDFSSAKDEYTDEVMHTVLEKHSSLLTKQPFHHESLLVDRKDKKLSQAEKRLARRGYELEKMAANCSRPSYNYIPGNTATRAGGLQIRAIRGGDQGVAQKPVASVRPMQQRGAENLGNRGAVGSRWIPAEVWQRQGMSAQEMTLPLDVVIPTNSPDKSSIVLKAGQRVMVLKSPKGIYMQLESGKIIAIRTALKINQQKREEEPKKAPPAPSPRQQHQPQPQKPEVSFPLRNNSAISIIPKTPNTAATTTTNVPATTPPIPRPLSRPGSASGYRQFSDKDMKRPKPNMMPTPPKMPQVPMHRGFKGKHEMDHSSANENSNSSDSQPRTDQRIEEVRLEDIVGESDANTEYPNNQNRLRNNQEITVEEKTHDFGTDPMTSVKMGVPRVPEPEPVESGAPREEKKGRPPNFTHRYPPPNIKDDNDEIIIEEANIRQPMPIPHQPPIVPQPIQHPPVQQPQPIPPEIPKMAEQNQTTPVKERAPDNSTDPQHAYPYAQYPRYYDYPDPRSRTTTTPYGYYPGGSQKTEPKTEFSQTPAQPQQANPIEPPPPAPKTEAPAPPAPAPPQPPPPPTTSANVPTAFSQPTPARSYAGSYPPYDPYSQHYSAAGGSTPAYPPAGTPGYGAYGTPSYNADYARMYSAFGPPPPPDPYIHRGYAPPPTNHPSNYYTPFSHPPPPPYPNYSFIPGYPNPNIPNESQPPAQ